MACSMDGATLVEKQKRKGRGEHVIGEILFALTLTDITDISDEIVDISDIIADLTRSRLIQLREIINPTPSIHGHRPIKLKLTSRLTNIFKVL